MTDKLANGEEGEGWDYDLFRTNLDLGAFDSDTLIERREMARVARHLLKHTDPKVQAVLDAAQFVAWEIQGQSWPVESFPAVWGEILDAALDAVAPGEGE